MANIPLKSIKFPDLADTYTVPSNAGELPYNKSATYPADTVGKALQDKPDADGTIANAEQLTSNIYEEDSVPYNFRTSGGSIDIGDRETDMLVGGTVAWNQLIENGNFATDSLWSTSNATKVISDGICTFTASAKNGYVLSYGRKFPSTPNQHVYIAMVDIKLTTGTTNVCLRLNGGYKQKFTEATTNWQTVNAVYKCYNGDNGSYQIIDMRESGLDAIQVRNAMLIDATILFGSTIADYIYSLEQGTAGAGVAWFRKLFPKPYYEYNAGELMSVNASSHDMVGFNAWDEEWEVGAINTSNGTNVADNSRIRTKNYIRIVPSATYYVCIKNYTGTIGTIAFYDADKNFIGVEYEQANTTITVPSNANYMRIGFYPAYGTTYNNDICINLSWDGERDGEYEAYVKHSYPLDSSLTLRGIPKLDANGNLYYDGDTYESDGKVTRNTILRAYQSGDESLANAITDGTNTVVYSANASTETADTFVNPQIVDDFGTEEYVDYAVSQGDRDVSIPVGHYTQYMANLKAKLEMSPNSPEGAGDYIVRQTNGENEYVTLASNATIQDIIARLEALENA